MSAHGRPIAKITALNKTRDLTELRSAAGISWSGGKPTGMARPAAMKNRKRQIADIVIDERR